MVKTVVISVDGSPYSQEAINVALKMARSYKAQVKFITVIDSRIYEWGIILGSEGVTPFYPSVEYQEDVRGTLEAKAKEILKRCEEIGKDSGLSYTTKMLEGYPAPMIVDESRVGDLLFMGKQGEHAKDTDDNLIGSTVDKVIRKVSEPVILVDKAPAELNNILVGYDGSKFATHALHWAADIASKLSMTLKVVVVDDSGSEPAQEASEEAREYLKPFDIDHAADIYSGAADAVVLEQAESSGADIIAIGGSSHSKVRDALLGSTAERIIRKARAPVLLAR